MPIRKENLARYPKNWKTEVVPRIRARSGNRCECTGQCGRIHANSADYSPDPAAVIGAGGGPRCGAWNHMPIDDIEGPCIVLTVMHLNHEPEDCRDENLLHACQGCHNRYDAPVRAAGIKARRHATRAIGDLFCEDTSEPSLKQSLEPSPEHCS
jgi:hypothetical protein